MGDLCARFGIDSKYSFFFSLFILIRFTELSRQVATAILEAAIEMGQNHSNANYIVVFVRVVTLKKGRTFDTAVKFHQFSTIFYCRTEKTSPAWYKSPILYSISEFLGNGLTKILWYMYTVNSYIVAKKKHIRHLIHFILDSMKSQWPNFDYNSHIFADSQIGKVRLRHQSFNDNLRAIFFVIWLRCWNLSLLHLSHVNWINQSSW